MMTQMDIGMMTNGKKAGAGEDFFICTDTIILIKPPINVFFP